MRSLSSANARSCLIVAASAGLHPRRLTSMCADPDGWPLLGRHNAQLKLLRTLKQRKHREREGLVVLVRLRLPALPTCRPRKRSTHQPRAHPRTAQEGQRLVLDALEAGQQPTLLLVADELASRPEAEAVRTAAARLAEGSVARVPMSMLDGLSDTQTPQGVLAMMPQPSLAVPDKPSLVLVFDRISDPGNMGTLLRSAVGAGAHVALTLPGCSDPWGQKALRAGMGAQLRMPIRAAASWEDAARQLDGWGCAAFAADARGESAHYSLDWREPCALVVGSEAHGLSEEIATDRRTTLCRIPMYGGIESLNAAMAGAIMLFEAQRQRTVGSEAGG